MAARTVQRFSQLVGALDRDPHATKAAQLAREVATEAMNSESWREADKRTLRELVHQLSARLADLDRQLSDAELAAERPQRRAQLTVAFAALEAACFVACRLGLPPSDTYRLISSASLVLSAGRSSGTTEPSGVWVAGRAVDTWYWRLQLAALSGCLLLCRDSPPSTATAFASTTLRPAALLPWISHATPVLGWLVTSSASEGVAVHIRSCYVLLADELATQEWFARHREALKANLPLAAVVAEFMLHHTLPEAAAAAASQTFTGLDTLSRLLCSEPFVAGVGWYCVQPGRVADAAAAMQHAAAILCSLPPAVEGEAPPEPLAQQYFAACDLLSTLCITLHMPAQRALDEHAAGGSSSGGSSEPAGSSSKQSSTEAEPGDPWLTLGPACYAVLRAMTKVAAFIIATAPFAARSLPGFEAVLVGLTYMLPVAGLVQGRKAPLPMYCCWLDAAQAAARLQPVLAQLHPDSPRHAQMAAAGNPQTMMQRLSGGLLQQVWAGTPIGYVPLGALPVEEAEQRASLAGRMWQLHLVSCWLVAYAAGGQPGEPSPVLAWQQMDGKVLWQLLDGLNHIFTGAHILMLPTQAGKPLPLGPKAANQLRALCAAHFAAVQALSDAAAACGGFAGGDSRSMGQLLDASARLAGVCPFLVGHSFFRPEFATCSAEDGEMVLPLHRVVQVAGEAADNPRLMAAAVCAGLFNGVPQVAVQAAKQHCEGRASLAVDKCLAALAGLAQAAEEAVAGLTTLTEVGSGSGSGAPGYGSGSSAAAPAASEQQQARAAVREKLQLGLASIKSAQQVGQPQAAEGQQAPLEQRANVLGELLRAAHPAAAALLHFYELPEQAAVARLQTARAAAARSCAYLCCANLACGGSPAAGTGAGTAKCSRCRAVWYCGTACSHADWRGPTGHRYVCKALGEERQQRREAGPQPQAAGAEADWWERNAAASGRDVLVLDNGL